MASPHPQVLLNYLPQTLKEPLIVITWWSFLPKDRPEKKETSLFS